LKTEQVPYIVAPYEADAQLTYLERAGFVDGIITEDSDLLVFGCKNVHFKLDAKDATVISISRSDFGSPALVTDSMSFVGWSDDQFRWMAMLSGCDYLPSIAGVGLKTAWSLLKKYKTVDKAIRAVCLEGKKDVPRGYLRSFKLAEKVFLHQRVYDPGLERLVYLSPPLEASLSEEGEQYVGRYVKIHCEHLNTYFPVEISKQNSPRQLRMAMSAQYLCVPWMTSIQITRQGSRSPPPCRKTSRIRQLRGGENHLATRRRRKLVC
jgi:exonuclease-1